MSTTSSSTEEAEVDESLPAGERRSRSKVLAGVRSLLGPFLILVGFVCLWYLVAVYLLPPHRRFLVPTPNAVIASMIAGESRTVLLHGLWETVKVSMTGLTIAIIVGGLVAVMMSQAAWIERSLYPYAVLLQVIPILAIVPLIGLAFGFNFWSRVIVCTIIAIFPIITNTLFGLKSADPDMHALFTLQRASRWQRFWRLQFRSAQPAIFTGIRISAGLAVVGAIVGDFFFRQGSAGLGVLLDRFRLQLRTEELYGAIFYAAALGLVVFLTAGVVAKRVVGRWHESYASDEPR